MSRIPSRSHRRWNNGEVEILGERYPDSLMGEIMTAIPGRTSRAITAKAIRLGIKSTKEKISEGASRGAQGRHISEETKRKMSETRKGKGNSFYGRKHSEETRRKISEAQKGNKPWNTGRHLSEEHKQKISDSHKGKPNPEHSKRLKELFAQGKIKPAFKGKHHSEEAKRKISEANKGYVHSEEALRKMSENSKGENNPMFGRTGENSPNWRGGKSFEPYSPEFNEQLKREIRERDNHTCQICDMIREESVEKYHRVLSVHHIDGDKKNSDKKNLVTLCIPCNTRLEFWGVRPQFGMN